MTPFTTLTSVAAPLLTPDLDTEVIVRISRLMEFGKGELGPYAFEPLRTKHSGVENPDFIFNQPAFRNSRILIGGENFGCGSSREAAVWALADLGLRCIIAPSFGDIFAGNCFQNGLLTVVLSRADIASVVAEIDLAGPTAMTVDLQNQKIVTPRGRVLDLPIEPQRRQALLLGLDEIAQTLMHSAKIAEHQKARRSTRPWANGTLESLCQGS